jgi:hypothetical protein
MTLITALVLVPGLAGIIYYLRRIALALEAAEAAEAGDAFSPEQPTVHARGFGGAGPMRKWKPRCCWLAARHNQEGVSCA